MISNPFSKVILYCCIAVVFSVGRNAMAQDTIIKLNRVAIPAKVEEVGPIFVKFTTAKSNFTDIKGIDRKDIYKIKYANGSVDTIRGKRIIVKKTPAQRAIPDAPPDAPPKPPAKENGYIYLTVSDLFYSQISGGIEYTFPGGYLSVGVPVSFGMVHAGLIDSSVNSLSGSNSNGYFRPLKIFSSGISFNFYPAPRSKALFFLNLSIGTGRYKYENYDYYTYNLREASYVSIHNKFGVKLIPAKHWTFSFAIGPGFTRSREGSNYYNDNYIDFGIEGGFHIGYTIGK